MATYNGVRSGSDLTGTPAASIATSASISVAVRDEVQLGVKCEGADTTCTMADNLGNIYPLIGSQNHALGEPKLFLFKGRITIPGNATITATFGGSRPYVVIGAHAFSPGVGNQFIDDSPGFVIAQGSSNAPASGSLAIAGPGIASAFFSTYSSFGGTQGTGWTETIDQDTFYAEYRLPSGSGSINGDFAWSQSDRWVAGAMNSLETPLSATVTAPQNARRIFILP